MVHDYVRFNGEDDCNPGASAFSSLVPFCLPACKPIDIIEPTQEPPVVVTPIIDPPNIDFGCFPLKTKSILTQFTGHAVFDFINDYSRASLSKKDGETVYGDYDYCQPILTARINVPPAGGTEVYPAQALEPLCGDNTGEVQLFKQQGSQLVPYKTVNACAAGGAAPEGYPGVAHKKADGGNVWTFVADIATPVNGIVVEAAIPVNAPGEVIIYPEGDINKAIPAQATNVSPFQLLAGDKIIAQYLKFGEDCGWRVKREPICIQNCTTVDAIAAGATGRVIVRGETVDDVKNEGDSVDAGVVTSVAYEPGPTFPEDGPDPQDKLTFPCGGGGGGGGCATCRIPYYSG